MNQTSSTGAPPYLVAIAAGLSLVAGGIVGSVVMGALDKKKTKQEQQLLSAAEVQADTHDEADPRSHYPVPAIVAAPPARPVIMAPAPGPSQTLPRRNLPEPALVIEGDASRTGRDASSSVDVGSDETNDPPVLGKPESQSQTREESKPSHDDPASAYEPIDNTLGSTFDGDSSNSSSDDDVDEVAGEDLTGVPLYECEEEDDEDEDSDDSHIFSSFSNSVDAGDDIKQWRAREDQEIETSLYSSGGLYDDGERGW
ncbi:hypothetical protein [Mollivirus kamchatka]|nr:hypothetical protein [Mollivirus kamchatka]